VGGGWFSTGTPVSSTNKTDRHDIAKILLEVTLNTITLNLITSLKCEIKGFGFGSFPEHLGALK